jgi:hypothetical protein
VPNDDERNVDLFLSHDESERNKGSKDKAIKDQQLEVSGWLRMWSFDEEESLQFEARDRMDGGYTWSRIVVREPLVLHGVDVRGTDMSREQSFVAVKVQSRKVTWISSHMAAGIAPRPAALLFRCKREPSVVCQWQWLLSLPATSCRLSSGRSRQSARQEKAKGAGSVVVVRRKSIFVSFSLVLVLGIKNNHRTSRLFASTRKKLTP